MIYFAFALQIKSSGLKSEQDYLYHGKIVLSTQNSFNLIKALIFFDFRLISFKY